MVIQQKGLNHAWQDIFGQKRQTRALQSIIKLKKLELIILWKLVVQANIISCEIQQMNKNKWMVIRNINYPRLVRLNYSINRKKESQLHLVDKDKRVRNTDS